MNMTTDNRNVNNNQHLLLQQTIETKLWYKTVSMSEVTFMEFMYHVKVIAVMNSFTGKLLTDLVSETVIN